LDDARREGKLVGLHSTMGALHGGHRSNIRQMAAECDVAAVSIFLGPLPLGPGDDDKACARDLEGDLAQAEDAGADIVLASQRVFEAAPLVTVRVGELAEALGGPRRPGHFDGVATLVTKLLAIAGPCYVYFGEKDYQQLVIVRRLVADLSLPVVVVSCPTVREPDGLALSSRNAYLSATERQVAPLLYWALLAGQRAIADHDNHDNRDHIDSLLVRAAMTNVAARPPFQLDYAEVVDPYTLAPVATVSGEVRLLIAGRIGRARLIDNLAANTKED
jgi:pantoate--beta-alanine ligase